MPKIDNPAQAFDLADKIFKTWEGWHRRLAEWRKLVDREMADTLDVFKEILPQKLRDKWWAYQSPEVQNEAQNLAHILASNAVEIEIISKSSDPTLLRRAQELEEADEALIAELMPVQKRILRYMGMLTDGLVIEAIDVRKPGKHQQAYADRKTLEAEAEKDDDADDDSPTSVYRRAYKKAGDHQKAYSQVMREAAMMDECLVDDRIVHPEQFAAEFDERDNLKITVERSRIALSAAIGLLDAYGVKKENDRLVLSVDRKGTDTSALTSERTASDNILGTEQFSCAASEEIDYVQIRTAEEILICVRGIGGDTKDDGIIIRMANPFDNSLGYVLTTGVDKIRSLITKRMEPYLLPLMVETQVLNALMSGMLAMAWAEASREEYEQDAEFPVVPIDATGETKAPSQASGSATKNVSAGEIQRVPTTDIDLKSVTEATMARLNEYRSREFFAGTGNAGESGRLVARIQTAQLTKLVPLQAKCSTADKEKLQIVHGWVRKSGQTVTIAQEPQLDKKERDGIQVAKAKEITPKLAALPVSLRVTTGANTPEGEFAMQQVGRENLAIKAIGMTTYRSEYMHVKDPARIEAQMVEDQFTDAFIAEGVAAGIPLLRARAQQIVDAIKPPPPPLPEPDPNVLPPPDGSALPAPVGGSTYIPPAVPGQPGPPGVGPLPDVTTSTEMPV